MMATASMPRRIARVNVTGPYKKTGTPARRFARLEAQCGVGFPNAYLVAQVAEDRGMTDHAELIRCSLLNLDSRRRGYLPEWSDKSEAELVNLSWITMVHRVRRCLCAVLGWAA